MLVEDSSVNTLIILGPKEQFNENQLKAIDAFLMRNGSLLIAADGVNIQEGLMSSANEIGINLNIIWCDSKLAAYKNGHFCNII